ncbi:MAG: hypothetical protein GQE15_12275 [Archangiaceae bacterium]|nr:hypothetical protein [Archangiaceae bacterium]
MTRSLRLAAAVLAVTMLSCQPPPPTLDLLVGAVRPDFDATVSVTATNGDGTPGTGLVELSTTLGTLSAGSLTLVEGGGRTTVRCSRSTSGCAAGGMLQVTARWTSSSGVITQTATARIVAAIDPTTDAGVVDAGVRDAGTADAGIPADGGMTVLDAGLVILAGTPLNLAPGEGLVLGRLGAPRTLGFSPFSSAAVVRLGFDRMPDQAVILSNRLVYVRNGNVWVWQEDEISVDAGADAGEVDGGELDGGELDGGELDAGEVDAGPGDAGADAGQADSGVRDGGADAGDTGPFPLFAPEANDPLLASCEGRFGPDAGLVRALVTTPAGGLWLGCSRRADAGIELYTNRALEVATAEPATPIAANELAVLALTDDGGLRLVSNDVTPQLQGLTARTFAPAARATASGFEVLAFDPVFNLCTVVSIDFATGTMREFQLLPPFPAGRACLDAQFFGQRDALLYLPSGGIRSIPFARPRPDAGVDAGVRDGGTDGGTDAGMSVDAGVLSGFFFVEGPPSDFKAMPPTLSIDFSRPVKLVAP